MQVVVISGVVHGEPVRTVTQQGEAICSFDVAVVDVEGRTLVPVAVRGGDVAVVSGLAVAVRGRVVKRFHRAGPATVARTSVEATEVLIEPRPAAVRSLTERAVRDGAVRPSPRRTGTTGS